MNMVVAPSVGCVRSVPWPAAATRHGLASGAMPRLAFTLSRQGTYGKSSASYRILRGSQRKYLPIVAARTECSDIPLGNTIPSFELLEPLTGRQVSLQEVSKGKKGILVAFICNHCPFVIHLRDAFIELSKYAKQNGIGVIAISANSIITHPQDGPEKMAEDARNHDYPFHYLYDETQEVAKAFKAACTPEFYLADKDLKLVYHGQFDDSRPKADTPVTGKDLRNAIESLLRGKPAEFPAKPSLGCGIKWHPAKQPA